MEKKKINLVTQYTLKSLLILGILILYVVSRENFGFKQYEPIISKFYYIGLIFYGLIGLIRKEEKIDESAERILGRVNQICLNVTITGLIILMILVGAPMYKEVNLSRDMIGLFMLILLFIITSLKPVLFHHFDRKGF
ncbi:hypothetical protein NE686_19920 [Tissierella carlieri]|uniref:Uncharacterized protein n=1 Tax=Tissierella carlieri TaxID=689904 RepID=A0ABT1SHG3_9FIRM|nr:hypothetical protein [Tissierella carlieri]MCQ4925382.1 hypothetical protein [Tissierella carlieri]